MSAQKKGFFYRWLRHRGLLLMYTGFWAALLYGYTHWAFGYIRTSSRSLSTDFWLRSVFYVGLLLLALGVALVFDRFLNHSRFISHVFGGAKKSDPETFDTGLLRGGQASFYIVLLLAVGFGWWGYDRLNDTFHAWYKTYGQYYTRLRSPKEGDRIRAITHLAKLHNDDTAKLLNRKILGGTQGEKLAAIWMAGKSDFNHPLIVDALEEVLKTTNRKEKEAVLLALSRVVTNPKISTMREIEALLKESLNDGKPPSRHLLFAAAFLRNPDFVDLFLDLFALKDETTRVILTYALVWVKGATPLKERRIMTRLTRSLDNPSERLRCMTTIGLTFKYESLDDPVLAKLRREFEAKKSVFKCSPEIFSLHPEGTKEDTINITRLNLRGFKYPAFGQVRYRERILRILALNRDDSMIPWFKRIEKNPQLPEYLRALAGQAARKKFDNSKVIDW